MSTLLKIFLLGCLPLAFSGPLVPRADPFEWAALGDSWASGVAYLPTNMYDGNKGLCLRINQAYAALLEKDKSWTTNGQKLHFPACSGAKLGDMAVGVPPQGKQMLQAGSPQAVVMTVGGNDASFFDIATSCIYHQKDGIDWGPDYADDPKRVGACARAIDTSSGYITGPNDADKGKSLGRDLIETINDLLKTKAAGARKGFTLYVTGYAHFFNLEDDKACNDFSFGIYSKPKLSHVLRRDVNHLTTALNDKIQEIVHRYHNVKYISITEGFDNHRFCETRHSLNNQYYSSDIWLWNLVAPGLGPSDDPTSVDYFKDSTGFAPNGGHVWDGWKQRPFHPKQQGHQVIANAIIKQMRADKLPGVKLDDHPTVVGPLAGTPIGMPWAPKSTTAPPPAQSKPKCPSEKFYGTDVGCNKGECKAAGGTCHCQAVGRFVDACTCRC